jgi:predicted kinase
MVAMGGLVASGKSTIARAIARERSAAVVVADDVRNAVLGLAANDSSHEATWKRSYAPGLTDAVYAELLCRADAALASGRSAVVDACFPTRGLRAAARNVAAERGAAFLFVECRADARTILERLCARARADGVAVEAWLLIASDFRGGSQAADELSAREHIVIDTARPLPDNLKRLQRRLAACAPGARVGEAAPQRPSPPAK